MPGQKDGWWFKEWELARRMMVAMVIKETNHLSWAEEYAIRDEWSRIKGMY